MMRQVIYIDGNNFNDMASFYNEIERSFTKDLDWTIGRNLNAFNDVLRGGFGVYEYGELILIKWINFNKSVTDLGQPLMDTITQIILNTNNSGHDCILEKLD